MPFLSTRRLSYSLSLSRSRSSSGVSVMLVKSPSNRSASSVRARGRLGNSPSDFSSPLTPEPDRGCKRFLWRPLELDLSWSALFADLLFLLFDGGEVWFRDLRTLTVEYRHDA